MKNKIYILKNEIPIFHLLLLNIFFVVIGVVGARSLSKQKNNFQAYEAPVALCVHYDSNKNVDNLNNRTDNFLNLYYYNQLLIKYNQCNDLINKIPIHAKSQILIENVTSQALTIAEQLKIVLLHFTNEKKFQTDLKVYPSLETVVNNEYFFITGKRISVWFPNTNYLKLRGGGNKSSQLSNKSSSSCSFKANFNSGDKFRSI